MNDEKWRTTIYAPYVETWKILKLIQYADNTTNSDEQWQRYMSEIERLDKQYPGNKFVEKLQRLLYDAGDVIAKVNKNEAM